MRGSRDVGVVCVSVRNAMDTSLDRRRKGVPRRLSSRVCLPKPNFCPVLLRLYHSGAIQSRRISGILKSKQPPSYLELSIRRLAWRLPNARYS